MSVKVVPRSFENVPGGLTLGLVPGHEVHEVLTRQSRVEGEGNLIPGLVRETRGLQLLPHVEEGLGRPQL